MKKAKLENNQFSISHDLYGRISKIYDVIQSNAIVHKYAKESVETVEDFIPICTYIGDYSNDAYNGQGILYCSNKKRYEGTFENGAYKDGVLYYANGFVEFEGTFENNNWKKGIAYQPNGKINWSGSFHQGLPHGNGVGSLREYTFRGHFDHGKRIWGTLTNTKSQQKHYYGFFQNDSFHGPGKWFLPHVKIVVFQRSYFEFILGDFENGWPTFGLQQIVDERSCLSFRFDRQNVWKYVGHFGKFNEKTTWHGLGAYFIRVQTEETTITYKFVGNFVQNAREGSFFIYETDEQDPLLKIADKNPLNLENDYKFDKHITYDYGKLVGDVSYHHNSMDTNNIHFSDFSVYKPQKGMQYYGEGYIDYYQFTDAMFIAHGLGTVTINSKRRYIASFYYGIPTHFHYVYDENENLLWSSTEREFPQPTHKYFLDSNEEWPAVHGFGIVHDSSGNEIYRARFNRGAIDNLKALLKDMLSEKMSFETAPEDYISLQKFRNKMFAITINDNNTNIISVKTFLTAMENGLKDPLRGSYPALRFKKIQVEIS